MEVNVWVMKNAVWNTARRSAAVMNTERTAARTAAVRRAET